METTAPALVALILNSLGVHIFLSPIHFPASPYLSSLLFAIGLYAVITQINLYPKSYKRIPLPLIRLYEMFGCVLLLEAGLCLFWFPLETFVFVRLQLLIALLRRVGWLPGAAAAHADCPVGVVVSYVLSVGTLLVCLHGTDRLHSLQTRLHAAISNLTQSTKVRRPHATKPASRRCKL